MTRRHLAALGAAVTAWTLLGLPAHATYGARVTADEPQYLLSAISLAHDGDLDIADELAEEAYRPFHRVDLPRQTMPGTDGRELSPHDPLLPLLLALPVRLGGWVAAKATIAALAGALAAVTAWVAVVRAGVRPRTAILTVAACSSSAPLATYATQIYPEVPGALATMIAIAAVTGPLDRRGRMTALLSCTALVWLSVKYAPVALAVAGVGVWRLRRQRPALAGFLLGLVAFAATHAIGHHALYGGFTPYAVGDHFVANGGELSVIGTSPDYVGRARRLAGLIVDRGFGLAAWAPLWLALPWAAGVWSGRRPFTSRHAAIVAPLAVGWFVATFVALTMHGWWWPGRQVVVVLPCGVVLLAAAIDRARLPRVVTLVAALLGIGTWVFTTVEAIARRRVLIVDFDHTQNPWYRLWRTVLPDGRRAAMRDDVVLALWAALLVAGALAGYRRARHTVTCGAPGSTTATAAEEL